MRTFTKLDDDPDNEAWVSRNPWLAPGSAPVFGPCGAAGGFPRGCPWGAPRRPADDCGQEAGAMGGFSYGALGHEHEFPDVVTTTWRRGDTVTLGWGMAANINEKFLTCQGVDMSNVDMSSLDMSRTLFFCSLKKSS